MPCPAVPVGTLPEKHAGAGQFTGGFAAAEITRYRTEPGTATATILVAGGTGGTGEIVQAKKNIYIYTWRKEIFGPEEEEGNGIFLKI